MIFQEIMDRDIHQQRSSERSGEAGRRPAGRGGDLSGDHGQGTLPAAHLAAHRGSRSKIRDAEADIGRYELRDAQSRIGELRSSFVSLRSRKKSGWQAHMVESKGESAVHL